MHILYLSYFYPPNGSVGGVRSHHLSRGLVEHGHRVSVIAATSPASAQDPNRFDTQPPEGLRIHRCGVALGLLEGARSRALGRSNQQPDAYQSTLVDLARRADSHRVRDAALQLLRSDYLPEPEALWNPEALRACLRVSSADPIDVVVCSGRPFASFWVAAAVASLRGVPLVLDLRDPWSLLEHNTGNLRAYVRAREKILFAAADLVIVNTHAARQAYAAEYGDTLNDKLIALPNGIGDPSPPGRLPPTPPRELRLLHGGNIYRRSITPLLQAVARLQACAEPCAFRQVGNIDPDTFDPGAFESLGDTAQLHPRVPFDELAAHVAWANVAVVLLGPDHHLRIPAKLYECLASGRAILFLGPADHEAVPLLERLGVGVGAISSDPDDIVRALRALRDDVLPRLRTHPIGDEVLAPHRFRRRAEVLARALEALVGGVNRRTQQSDQRRFTDRLRGARRVVLRTLAFVQRHIFGVPPELPLPARRS